MSNDIGSPIGLRPADFQTPGTGPEITHTVLPEEDA
jgi:hypothetical protein